MESAGHQTWAVGGAVRDVLAGLPPGDWDLATSARPGQVRRLFRRTVPVGVEHGTVGVIGGDGVMYEVTTFRRDVESFGRKARVTFAATVEEDLERRDFTINAVAWHPLSRELRDPHGGAGDLKKRVLRTVGEAGERFREDRLRVLRALRFAGRFGLEIDPATWRAVLDSSGTLGDLSAERVREELMKVLSGSERPADALSLYASSGVLADLYPELERARGRDPERWSRTLRVVDATPRLRARLRLASLFLEARDTPGKSAASAREIMRRLKFSNADTDRVVHLVAQHASLPGPDAGGAGLRRWLSRVGPEHAPDLLRLRAASLRGGGSPRGEVKYLAVAARRLLTVLRAHPPLAVADLAINGEDLKRLGIKPGPAYGRLLRELLERVLEEPELNQREALLGLVPPQ